MLVAITKVWTRGTPTGPVFKASKLPSSVLSAFRLLVVVLAPGTEDSQESDFQFQRLQLSGLLAIYLIFVCLFISGLIM